MAPPEARGHGRGAALVPCACRLGRYGALFALYASQVHRLKWASERLFGTEEWQTSAVPCSRPRNLAAESNTTRLRVVVASVGQTGTTTITELLRLMGVRVFHIEETAIYARAALRDLAAPAQWARAVSRCRLEGIALEPETDLLPTALRASPGARVVLGWRDFPSWRASTGAGAGKDDRWSSLLGYFTSACRALPWVHIADAATGLFTDVVERGEPFYGPGQLTLLHLLFMRCAGDVGYALPVNNAFSRGVYKVQATEEGYLSYMDEVRQVTPEGRLLEFDVRTDTAGKLARFLGIEGVDESKPLPRPRTRSSFTNDALFDNNLGKATAVLLLLCLLHLINCWILWTLLWLLCWVPLRSCCRACSSARAGTGNTALTRR